MSNHYCIHRFNLDLRTHHIHPAYCHRSYIILLDNRYNHIRILTPDHRTPHSCLTHFQHSHIFQLQCLSNHPHKARQDLFRSRCTHHKHQECFLNSHRFLMSHWYNHNRVSVQARHKRYRHPTYLYNFHTVLYRI